jgi:hypothetical protein
MCGVAYATWRRSGCSSRIGTKTLTKFGPATQQQQQQQIQPKDDGKKD